uniref:Uncharacterized protein n=1 Tax=Timema shepardi TaxID=629360 RepID=A0A7R9G1W3_TIMSH|nr:unnamed protein product [Timema shepardi]
MTAAMRQNDARRLKATVSRTLGWRGGKSPTTRPAMKLEPRFSFGSGYCGDERLRLIMEYMVWEAEDSSSSGRRIGKSVKIEDHDDKEFVARETEEAYCEGDKWKEKELGKKSRRGTEAHGPGEMQKERGQVNEIEKQINEEFLEQPIKMKSNVECSTRLGDAKEVRDVITTNEKDRFAFTGHLEAASLLCNESFPQFSTCFPEEKLTRAGVSQDKGKTMTGQGINLLEDLSRESIVGAGNWAAKTQHSKVVETETVEQQVPTDGTHEYANVTVASETAIILVLLVVDLCCLPVMLVAVPGCVTYSSPMASLVLTDSSQLTSDSQHLVDAREWKAPEQVCFKARRVYTSTPTKNEKKKRKRYKTRKGEMKR